MSAPPRELVALADRAAARYGIPKQLFRGLIKNESGWNVSAQSPVGAKGLTQLTDGKVSDPFNPAQNLEGGARYLKQQFDHFKSWPLALAAYNSGPGAVEKYGGIPPYAETQRYVHNLMGYLGGKASAPRTSGKAPAVQLPTSARAAAQPLDLASYAMSVLSDIASGSYNPQHSLGALTDAVVAAPPVTQAADLPSGGRPASAPRGRLPIEGDVGKVNQQFLAALERAVVSIGGTKLRVTSGYRSPEHNASVGGVPRSNHMTGHAIDGEVFIPNQGWVPIGRALKPVAGKFGLRSGDVPGFYHGGPDPVHVDDAFNQR